MSHIAVVMFRVISSGLLVAAALFAQAQDTVKVTRVAPKVGDVRAWTVECKFQAQGQEATMTTKSYRKVTKLEANGDYEVESTLKDGKMVIMGTEMEQPPQSNLRHFDKNDLPVGKFETDNDLAEATMAYLLVRYPDEGAKAGDHWAFDVKSFTRGKGVVTMVGIGKKWERECIELKMTYTVASGHGDCDGSVFFDKTNGELLGYDMKFTKVTIAPGLESDGSIVMIPINSGK